MKNRLCTASETEGNGEIQSVTMTTSVESNVNHNFGGKSVSVYKWNLNFGGTASDNMMEIFATRRKILNFPKCLVGYVG